MQGTRPIEVALPPRARLARQAFDEWDYADAYQVELPQGAPVDPRVWVEAIFLGRPFPERDRSEDEVLTFDSMGFLEFGVSVLIDDGAVTMSSLVRYRSWLGRLYFTVVKPFHRVIAPGLLRRAARRMSKPAAECRDGA